MSTTKPQFNCRIDVQTDTEIDEHSRITGVPKGKIVETIWSFYKMRDLRALRSRLCEEALTTSDPSKLSELYLLALSLQNILKRFKDDNET